jgi:hypothetical protein
VEAAGSGGALGGALPCLGTIGEAFTGFATQAKPVLSMQRPPAS